LKRYIGYVPYFFDNVFTNVDFHQQIKIYLKQPFKLKFYIIL